MTIEKIKKHLDNIKSSQKFQRFTKHARHPSFWNFDCSSVARGVAVGLFVSVIPVIPFQTLLIILLAIPFRANFPVAFLVSWVSNPITILPIAYATYFIGEIFLNENGAVSSIQPIHLNYNSMNDFFASLGTWASQFGKAFFIGLPILAVTVAVIGYIATILCWKTFEWISRVRRRRVD